MKPLSSNPDTVKAFRLHDDGTFPNHPKWPLLIYRSAVPLTPGERANRIERVFRQHGWGGAWRDGIFAFQHYHSTAHEVLGVFSGQARVQFGGPGGVEVELAAGDVAVIPAGTAHRRLEASADFGVVGAYPVGADWDLCRGEAGEHDRALCNIQHVPRPESDPVFGAAGGLIEFWKP